MKIKHLFCYFICGYWNVGIGWLLRLLSFPHVCRYCSLSLPILQRPPARLPNLWFSSSQMINLDYDNPTFCLLISCFVSMSLLLLPILLLFFWGKARVGIFFLAGPLKHSKANACNPFDGHWLSGTSRAPHLPPKPYLTSHHPSSFHQSRPAPVKWVWSVFVLRVWRR